MSASEPCSKFRVMVMLPSLSLSDEKYSRLSIPDSCCSITCTTVLCTVSAEAPGYVTAMATAGGATLGYCAMGSVFTARPPTIMMTMAMTHAKIGRSMKKSDTSAAAYCFCGALGGAASGAAAASGSG